MKSHLFVNQMKAFALVICMASFTFSQSTNAPTTKEDVAQIDLLKERALLLTELQFLDRETLRFNNPLAVALAKAEIADAAWQLDRNWAKKLLRKAYELALPEVDQKQDRPVGSIPSMPNAADRSQQKVRKQVLSIARRDKDFVNELVQMEAERLGAYEKQYASAVLADQSLMGGDVKAATEYILQGIKADPTQIAAPGLINAIALRDRALADRLILQYISELRKFPISSGNQSDIRTFIILSGLVKPYLPYDPSVNPEPIKVPPPSSEVMRAYIIYMLDALNILEQKESGYLQMKRQLLLSLWIPLQQYAPDLASTFLNLDSLSRRPGDKSPLPTAASVEEARRSQYENRVKEGLNSGQPSEAVIYAAISKGDFDKARKMIDKLTDEARKKQLSDMVNAEESISLATKGKIYEAENLAGRLNYATFILRVYPVLLKRCAVSKDQLCVTRLVHQALKQVETSDTSPPALPEGIPASAAASDQRFDSRLSFIGKLAKEVLPTSDELAFYVLDEFVSVANTNPTETDQARISSDISVFKKLAPKNEMRAQQAAYSLKNPVQRVLALAAIYQWKANELTERQLKPVKAS